MGPMRPETARAIEHIAALRAEADHLAREVLRTGERGTVTALTRTLGIASTTLWARYGRGLDRPPNSRTAGGEH